MNPPVLIDIRKTVEYQRWEARLNDVAAAAIDARIRYLQLGKKGDWRSVGEGVCELRLLRTGPGWRIYFHETNQGKLVLLLLGGDKASQKNDIRQAQAILHALKAALKKQQRLAQEKTARR